MDLSPPTASHLARELAACLTDAADRLDGAADLADFIAAVDAHRQIWQGMSRAAPKLGYLVSPQLVEFSLTVSGRANRRLNDHEVEALIHIDRFVAAAIAKACPAC